MGIKPTSGDPVVIPPDNTQSRWGEWEAELDDKGEVAGEVLSETWALAESANNRVGLLDPIMDFGQSYMPTGLGFSGSGRLPFRNQRGPARGVRIENDGIRLLGAGAWQITCEVKPSWVRLAAQEIIYRVRCYTPQGTVYTYQEFIDMSSSDTHTVAFGADFVVPEPNYFVAVHVYSIGKGRGHLGGYASTRLVAKRWSSEYINPPAGGASEEEEGP